MSSAYRHAPKASVTLYVAGSGLARFPILPMRWRKSCRTMPRTLHRPEPLVRLHRGLLRFLPRADTLLAEDTDLADLLSANTTPFVASGDWGAFEPLSQALSDGEVDAWFPASDSNVLAVGGTTAATANYQDPVRSTEYAWGLSGGNVSGKFPLPAWQVGVSGLASQTLRNLPDLALDADIYTGYTLIYTPAGGIQGTYFGGGTSLRRRRGRAYLR